MRKICTRCGSLGDSVCPSCGVQDTMIDINTPIGKKLYSKYHTGENNQEKVIVINNTEKKSNGCLTIFLILIFLFIVSFVIIPIIIIPIYRGYTTRAEEVFLSQTINSKQKQFYLQTGKIKNIEKTSYSKDFDFDMKKNKYFTAFDIKGNGSKYNVTLYKNDGKKMVKTFEVKK